MNLGKNISITLSCWSSAWKTIEGEITYVQPVGMILNEIRFRIKDLVWRQVSIQIIDTTLITSDVT